MSDPLKPELKPCPFCGDQAEPKSGNDYQHWVECQICGAMGPNKHSKLMAIEAWNRREGGQ